MTLSQANSFKTSFTGRCVILTALATIPVAAVVAIAGRVEWILGVIAAVAWISANDYLFWRMLAMVRAGTFDRGKLNIFLIVKFPVLYLLGLGLLVVPAVRLSGVLVGLTVHAAVVAVWWFKFKPHRQWSE